MTSLSFEASLCSGHQNWFLGLSGSLMSWGPSTLLLQSECVASLSARQLFLLGFGAISPVFRAIYERAVP